MLHYYNIIICFSNTTFKDVVVLQHSPNQRAKIASVKARPKEGEMEIEIARQIGQIVRKQRKALGLTQKELAEKAHIDRSLVIRIESGEAKSIYPEKLLSVLHALDLRMIVEPKRQRVKTKAARITVKKLSKKAVSGGGILAGKATSDTEKGHTRVLRGIDEKLLIPRSTKKKSK